MRPKTLLLLVVAIACGLVAAFMVNSISGSGPKGDTENYLVPKTDIPPGSKIQDVKTMFVSKPFQKGVLPLDAIKDSPEGYNKLKDQVPTKLLQANMPVTVRDLASNANILQNLAPGYRAVTVRADIASALHGFLHAGMKVDVLTLVRDPNNPQISKSQIFLQNITVLAVNTVSEKPKDKPTITNPVSMTLMVTPEELERLYLVSSRSTLGIGLRKPGDNDTVETKGATSPFDKDEAKGGVAAGVLIPVAVATREIPENTTIDRPENYFKLTQFQQDQLLGGKALVYTDLSELQGKTVYRYVAVGQPITKANLTPLGVKPEKVTDVGGFHRITIYNGPRVETADYGQSGAPVDPGVLPGGRRQSRPSTNPNPTPAPAPAPAVEPEGSESSE